MFYHFHYFIFIISVVTVEAFVIQKLVLAVEPVLNARYITTDFYIAVNILKQEFIDFVFLIRLIVLVFLVDATKMVVQIQQAELNLILTGFEHTLCTHS